LYSPGASIGRATARLLTGPLRKRDTPILNTGSKGEWDAGFVIPFLSREVLVIGTATMYEWRILLSFQEGSKCIILVSVNSNIIAIGNATSKDGILSRIGLATAPVR
jgi:hypothetical protein